jgi:DNA repair protein RadD
MEKLESIINQLATTVLEKLAGQTIIRAVKSAYETDSSRGLARLIVDRYGTNILYQSELRKAFIDRLPPNEALKACDTLKIKLKVDSDKYEAYELLNKRFSTSFTQKKAEEFVQIFNLPDSLIPEKNIDTRESEILVTSVYGEKLDSKGTLHPYQIYLKDAIAENIDNGQKRLLAQMPTGAGKTMTALELITDFIRSHKFKGLIVWIVDSNELADQALVAFNNLWRLRGDRPTKAYRFFSDFNVNFSDCSSGVVFTSFPKCYSSKTSNNLADQNNFISLCKRTGLVLVDEAHTSIASTYFLTINDLIKYDATLIGLSATPARNNNQFGTDDLRRMYANLIKMKDSSGVEIPDPIKYLQDLEYLAEIEYEPLDSNFELKNINEGEACVKLAENTDRNNIILKQIEKAVSLNESTIVFACTVDHVIALMALCRAKKIEADFIIGEVPQHKRLEIFDRFKKGDLKILINHEMLSTGIDLPNLNRLIITRPIGSPILYSQIIGRALRGPKNGGNKKNTIVNIQDNYSNYPDMNLLYQLFTNRFN